MRFRIVLLFTLFCSIPFLHAQEASQGAMLKRSIAHNGEMRDYFVFLPLGEFTDPLPVVFGIHGYTSTATGFEAVHGMNRHAQKSGYIAVYPQGMHFRVNDAYQVITMEDPTIPLTAGEWEEWGDPRKKAEYEYMLSYSPYDQLKKNDYPNLMITGGWHDAAVQYYEPLKWTARLRDRHLDSAKVLLELDMSSGHGGASARFAQLRLSARELAFFAGLAADH